jgi:hypothetical protein
MMRSMATRVFVEGVADDRLVDYRALTDVELRRRSEPTQGIFFRGRIGDPARTPRRLSDAVGIDE